MIDMTKLRKAIEASREPATASFGQDQPDNPALGQCYPTAWLVQHYFPEVEIVEGTVYTPVGDEKHFWNFLSIQGVEYHIDLTWQQFPHGAYVSKWRVWDREMLQDGPDTRERCELLKSKVEKLLAQNQ
jgi:hypothetical protein